MTTNAIQTYIACENELSCLRVKLRENFCVENHASFIGYRYKIKCGGVWCVAVAECCVIVTVSGEVVVKCGVVVD